MADADRADEAVEALLCARHGYRVAVLAAESAPVISLTDFLG
jgi:hypothetical protein